MVFLGACIYVSIHDLSFASVAYIEDLTLYVGRGSLVHLHLPCVLVYNNCVLYRYIPRGVCTGVRR